MIKEFALLSQQMHDASVRKQEFQELYNKLSAECSVLINNSNWEYGVYDVPGGHVVVDENITFYPKEKT